MCKICDCICKSCGCIDLKEKLNRYTEKRIDIYAKYERGIKALFDDMPSSWEIAGNIEKRGLSLSDFYSVYSTDLIKDALRYAKDLKDRYTALGMYHDIFKEEEINLK